MKNKDWKEEHARCIKGHEGMTEVEYFYYNYCKINGKLPEPNSYSRDAFKAYQESVAATRMNWNRRRVGKSWYFQEQPLTEKESFKLTTNTK